MLINGGLGFRVWGFWGQGLGLGFWGRGFQLMGVGVCGVGLSGFYGVGALYINIKKWCEKNIGDSGHIIA